MDLWEAIGLHFRGACAIVKAHLRHGLAERWDVRRESIDGGEDGYIVLQVRDGALSGPERAVHDIPCKVKIECFTEF